MALTTMQLHGAEQGAVAGAGGPCACVHDDERADIDGGAEHVQHSVLCSAHGRGRAWCAVIVWLCVEYYEMQLTSLLV